MRVYVCVCVCVCVLKVSSHVKDIKQCDSGLEDDLAQMRELYRREALQRKLLYNQVRRRVRLWSFTAGSAFPP